MSKASMIGPQQIAGEVIMLLMYNKLTIQYNEHPPSTKAVLVCKWASSWEDMHLSMVDYLTKITSKTWALHSDDRTVSESDVYPTFAGIDIDTKAEVSYGGYRCTVVYQYRIVHDDYMVKAWVKKDE